MTRQIEENILNKKLLNKKEAAEYLNVGRYVLECIIKSGELKFKSVGKRILFPVWALDEWQKSTTHHIDYTSEATYTTPTSHMCAKPDKEYSLEKVRERFLNKQQLTIASNAFPKFKRKLINNQPASCQA